jgi:hypothetical protein
VTISAIDLLHQALDQYGLGSLASVVWQDYQSSGYSSVSDYTSSGQMEQTITKSDKFKVQYPAYDALIAKKQGMTIAAYHAYTVQVNEALHQFGIPQGIYGDPQSIGKMLTGGVSANEAIDRIHMAAQASFTMPQEVRDQLVQKYGASPGAITAFFLDPDKAEPILQQQYTAAQVAGAAQQQGMSTSRAIAERLAAEGVTYSSAASGFDQARTYAGLQAAGGDAVSADQLALGIVGGESDAKAAILRASKGRTAEFQQSSSPAAGQTGVGGLGTTTTQ